MARKRHGNGPAVAPRPARVGAAATLVSGQPTPLHRAVECLNIYAMHSVPRLTAAVCLPLLWLCACGESNPREFPESPFSLLELERSEAVGFCPELGDVLTAELRRGADGTVTIQGERAEAEDPETGCDEFFGSCIVGRPFGPQTLTEAQVVELEDAIAAVGRKGCHEFDNIVSDPCLVTEVTVDTHYVDDYCNGDLKRTFAEPFYDLVDLIDTLAPPSRAFPGPAFTMLTLERTNGLGFCPDAGDVLTAEARRAADGTIIIRGERVEAGDPQTGTCDPDFGACLIRQSFGPLVLTEAQVAELEDAIAAVELRKCDEYEDIFVDPCLITRVTVDGVGSDDYCNGDLNSGFVQPFHALAGLLDTLAAPAQP
jgi:hypothetical protein